MAVPTRLGLSDGLATIADAASFGPWLEQHPLQWSTVVATRAALRVLPLDASPLEAILERFRATALARYSAKHPNLALGTSYIAHAKTAFDAASQGNDASLACASAVRAAAEVAVAREQRSAAVQVFISAASGISYAAKAASFALGEEALLQAVVDDANFLLKGGTFETLMDTELWWGARSEIEQEWRLLSEHLLTDGPHWAVWVDWYGDILTGVSSTAATDEAFTDLRSNLPWVHGSDAVCLEIHRRLVASNPDPLPVEGIVSPISIGRLPDGRIGIEPGPFSLPTVPQPFSTNDHNNALAACRSRAAQLEKIASLPTFQGRREYAQMIADYMEWLPNAPGAGNILLADGEARALNKLFTADESILPAGFASKLAILLEDHIALRSFYPEVERHYAAVNTGRLIKPLPRDAVEAIQHVIQSQTPLVFAETVSPAVDEAAKVAPDIKPLSTELPPADLAQPKPPRDPIADADPQKSRNYIIASAYNRIWALILRGKDTAQAIEGWQKTYELLKPYMRPILDFLRHFQSGDGPSLPPTIGA